MDMIEIIKQSIDKGGLIILLAGILLSIGGLYKLSEKRFDKIDARVQGQVESYHSLDKRVLVLEIRNGN